MHSTNQTYWSFTLFHMQQHSRLPTHEELADSHVEILRKSFREYVRLLLRGIDLLYEKAFVFSNVLSEVMVLYGNVFCTRIDPW
jgi:hypothetical protein